MCVCVCLGMLSIFFLGIFPFHSTLLLILLILLPPPLAVVSIAAAGGSSSLAHRCYSVLKAATLQAYFK